MARRDTRTAILDAAEAVARRVGLARVTTKEVAHEADCSEAAIYYHFADRTDLLADVVATRIAEVGDAVGDLQLDPAEAIETLLTRLVQAAVEAFGELIALSSPLLADPEVLARFRAVLDERSLSPHGIRSAVAEHLRVQQQAGNIRADVDAEHIALLIVGGCHEAALEQHLMGSQRIAGKHLQALGTALATLLSARPAAKTRRSPR